MNSEEWKYMRMRKKIILKEVAKYVGCSVSLINKWENGHLEMPTENVKRYREYIENK